MLKFHNYITILWFFIFKLKFDLTPGKTLGTPMSSTPQVQFGNINNNNNETNTQCVENCVVCNGVSNLSIDLIIKTQYHSIRNLWYYSDVCRQLLTLYVTNTPPWICFFFQGKTRSLYYGIDGMDNLPKVNLIMEKGDTVFFHPLVLHGSYPNRTKVCIIIIQISTV